MSHLSLRDRPQGVNQLQLVLLVGQLVDVRAGLLETPPGSQQGEGTARRHRHAAGKTQLYSNSTPVQVIGKIKIGPIQLFFVRSAKTFRIMLPQATLGHLGLNANEFLT